MGKPRVSIARVMAWIAAFGLGLAALRYASDNGAALAGLMTLFLLCMAVACSLVDAHRPFWLGFALCGWAYATLGQATWLDCAVRPQSLMVSQVLDALYPHRYAPRPAPMGFHVVGAGGDIGKGVATPGPPQRVILYGTPGHRAFQRIGSSLICLLFAYLGGVTTRIITSHAARNRESLGTMRLAGSNTPK